MESDILKYLKDNYFLILYGITLFFSVVKYPKYFDSVLKYFPILIAYTLCTEILGWYILRHEDYQIVYEGLADWYAINNSTIYNIFDIVFFLYFYFIYWKVVKSSSHQNVIKYGAFLFVLVSVVNPFFQSFWLYPQIYAIVIGSLLLVLCVFFYFQKLKKEENRISNRYNLLFWMSLGLLAFYPFYPAVNIIGLYHTEIYEEWFRTLHHALIALMYLGFTIGFLMMKRFRSP